MKRALLILAAALLLFGPTGCRVGTYVSYDPSTGKAEMERDWLGGPVDTGISITKPDGTEIDFWWKSDVDLSSAEAVTLAREANLKAVIEKIPVSAAVPGPVP